MKKALNATLLSAIVLLGAMASTPVFAHHGHHFRGGVGISIGVPAFYGPRYYAPYSYGYAPYYDYGPSYYGYPPAVVAPSSPPEYVEQGEAAPPARQSQRYQGEAAPPARQSQPHHWYYCAESKSYYPYVDRCAGPWQRVAPEPPPS